MMCKTKIISLTANFSHRGGGESMLVAVHRFFKNENYETYICSFDEYHTNLLENYGISKPEYIKLSFEAIRFIKNSTIISHHRKITTLLVLLNFFLRLKCRIIHVSNSEYHTLKNLTLFPSEVIAVSNRVKYNCINYFKIKENQIKVIYNGIEDKFNGYKKKDSSIIKILYIARIHEKKNQLQLVDKLKGKIKNVKISFVGVGPDYNELLKLTKNIEDFETKGFQSELSTLVEETDYFMLFSSQEGLPTCLIESCMFGRPFITNDVGGSKEILEQNKNGFLANNLDELIEIINNLKNINSDDYYTMCKNARNTYLEKFTLEKMEIKYKDFIKLN